ncbi:phage tail fiber protein [Enterobacter hormaechei]|uniref:phage tail fiber protein n=1 Tax=Enterobacter hormaechei TaxID=158836 RepID=UPI001AE22043|nr:phage tail protein [Enterobacter hormaechei]MBP0993015.1 phage tail protein [Enterobacter hormaechei]MBP1022377.1 phage tail protein [Enterobacter hormaechei]MBP1026907.1 phage tail protein [Enterobacter hormaechei]
MLYNTGTIDINGNTATGTGTNWTAPASQIRVGQTLFVLSNPVQMFQITAINSATSLTITPAASPALSGQKYGILVTDSLSVDGLAQSMSQLINEYDENIGAWETFATTSANQSITVTINGTPVTIPGIGKLAQKGSNGALAVADGGTGATNDADARTNLGLGSSATKNTGTTSDNVMQPGMFGLGLAYGAITINSTHFSSLINDNFVTKGMGLCAFRNDAQVTGGDTPFYQYSPSLFFRTRDTWAVFNCHFNGGPIRVFAGGISDTNLIISTNGRTLWDTKNTAVDSNGFIKQASPVVKIFTDGKYETNDESEGVTVTRLDVGQYLIEGCKALNSDAAWGGIDGGFEIPTDRNKQPLIWLDYKVNADGSVLVKTYHREHSSAPAFARNERDGLADGEPVDIPAHQFVSVRVEMPVDSIWNQKQTEEALKQEQGS